MRTLGRRRSLSTTGRRTTGTCRSGGPSDTALPGEASSASMLDADMLTPHVLDLNCRTEAHSTTAGDRCGYRPSFWTPAAIDPLLLRAPRELDAVPSCRRPAGNSLVVDRLRAGTLTSSVGATPTRLAVAASSRSPARRLLLLNSRGTRRSVWVSGRYEMRSLCRPCSESGVRRQLR